MHIKRFIHSMFKLWSKDITVGDEIGLMFKRFSAGSLFLLNKTSRTYSYTAHAMQFYSDNYDN